MKTFRIDVTRTAFATKTYEVKAESEIAAKWKACKMAENDTFSEDFSDYSVSACEEVVNDYIDRYGNPYDVEDPNTCWPAGGGLHKDCEFNADALYAYYNIEPYASTKKYINYYTIKVARLATTPPINHISDLTARDTLILKRNDYAALRLNYIDSIPFAREYHTPKDALTGIRSGRYKYFIWGEIPLASKIKELNLDGITLDEIDIPAGELRIIGYNKELIDIIDDEYTRLEQNGELEIIRDKWFHPERVHNDTSPVSLLILLGLGLTIFAGFLINRLITLRVNAAVRKSAELNSMMKTALGMGDFSVIEYDIEGNLLRNLHGQILPSETMIPQEFIRRMPPEQGKYLHECNTRLIRGEQQKFDIKILFNRGTDEHPEWRNYYGNAIAEIEDGKTKYIVYTTKDITNELKEERENRDLWNKYMKVFDTNIVAMSFYDSKGHLLDFNQEMRNLFGITDENASYFRSIDLFDVPAKTMSISTWRYVSNPCSTTTTTSSIISSPPAISQPSGTFIWNCASIMRKSVKRMSPSTATKTSWATCWNRARCSSGTSTPRWRPSILR